MEEEQQVTVTTTVSCCCCWRKSHCRRHRHLLLLLHCLGMGEVAHCALVDLWFGFHKHSRLRCCDWFHIEGTLRGHSAADRLVSLEDERELCLLLLQLLDLLLQRLLLVLPHVHLVLQRLRLVHSPLSASRCCQLVPLPPQPPPLLLFGAK